MRRLGSLAIAACLVLAACSGGSDDPSATPTPVGRAADIEIVRSETLAPDLQYGLGMEYREVETVEVWEGDGAALLDGQPILLDIYAESLDDGGTLLNTFDGLPRSFLLAPEMLGDGLYQALLGAKVGARLLHVAPPAEALLGASESTPSPSEPPIALVIDILPTAATGERAPTREDLPLVVQGLDGEPQITLRAQSEPPPEFTVATLIQGTGPQIREGSFVVVNYKAIHWGAGSDDDEEWVDGEPFDSSWPADKAPFETQIGVGQVIRGWDEGLLDKTAGSQVMLSIPPSYGYPNEGTLLFVVDLLDVWNP